MEKSTRVSINIVKIWKSYKPGYVGFYANKKYLESRIVHETDDGKYFMQRLYGGDLELIEISSDMFKEYFENAKLYFRCNKF